MKGEWKWSDMLWPIILILTIAIGMALSCFNLGVSYARNHTDEVVWQGTIELNDTRRVPCVATGYGLSCDWAHADGADVMGGDA